MKAAYELAFQGYKGKETIQTVVKKLFTNSKYREKFMSKVGDTLHEHGLTDEFITKQLMKVIKDGNYAALVLGLELRGMKKDEEDNSNNGAFGLISRSVQSEGLPEAAKKFIGEVSAE